jgi:hypothetical protein
LQDIAQIGKYGNMPFDQPGCIYISDSNNFIFGISAELIGGMAAFIGSFLAGLMFSRTFQKQEVEHSIDAIAYVFLVSIFFINSGLSVDISGFQKNTLGFIVGPSTIAIIGKVFGSGNGAKSKITHGLYLYNWVLVWFPEVRLV